MKRSLKRLIVLMISLSFVISPMSYAKNNELELKVELDPDIESELETLRLVEPVINTDLELPKEKIIQINGEPGVFYNLAQFQTILAIYSSYISLVDENMMLGEDMYAADIQYELCLTQLANADDVINTLDRNANNMAEVIKEQERTDRKNSNSRALFSTLVGAGGVVVGIVAGVLLGIAIN